MFFGVEKNRILSDEIIKFTEEYLEHFDSLAELRIKNFSSGIITETDEMKKRISQEKIERFCNMAGKSEISRLGNR